MQRNQGQNKIDLDSMFVGMLRHHTEEFVRIC